MEQTVHQQARPAVPPPLFDIGGLAVGAALQQVAALPGPGRVLALALGAVSATAGGLLVASGFATRWRSRGDLVTTGPYELTRNPIYVGLGFVYFGVAAALSLTWAVLLLPAVLYAVDRLVVAPEEHALLDRYGDEYRTYVATTRRWLLANWRVQ
jgi:protein-S-isoprenylcysteine O-methyltransferase Ste14